MVLPACEFSKSSRNNASRHLLLPEKWTLNSVRAIAETLAHGIQASQHFLFLLPGNYPYPSSVITDPHIAPSDFEKMLVPFWELAAEKVRMLETGYDPRQGPPVLTVKGRYTTRGWTDWTQGFQFGIPLLVFSATGESEMLGIGKRNTLERMSHHLTHFGVHDHGFSNLSTYGNLLRCALTGLFEASPEETELYKLAVMTSGAVQARRWTGVSDGGYIHSFNGPHSLFIDTMRTLRILVAAHLLGQRMLEENGREVDLLERAVIHGMTTARVAVYYGEGRDSFDVRGRVAHESIFNTADGSYRCPGSQQGYSGFTTWTRGLAWAMLGFAEFLEFLGSPGPANENPDPRFPGTEPVAAVFLKAAKATCDYYMEQSAADGIPYWDTGAPLLHRLGNYREERADPFNEFRGGHRRPGPDPAGEIPRGEGAGNGRALPPGRAHHPQDIAVGPVPLQGPGSPGHPAPFGLPQAQRLGPYSGGAEDPLRGVGHVGGLPYDRAVLHGPPADPRSTLHLFRRLIKTQILP
jgi:unsaturated chondroitin disaccharide hydrolase